VFVQTCVRARSTRKPMIALGVATAARVALCSVRADFPVCSLPLHRSMSDAASDPRMYLFEPISVAVRSYFPHTAANCACCFWP